MKTKLLITGLVLSVVTSFAQEIPESQVPASVVAAFKKDFPQATETKWEKKAGTHTVKFKVGGVDHKGWLDGDGKLLKHKTDIRESELPAAVTATLKNEYGNFKVSAVYKMQEGNATTYEMNLKNDTEKWEAIFSEDGKLIRKKQKDKHSKDKPGKDKPVKEKKVN
jgi:hypothetical protein